MRAALAFRTHPRMYAVGRDADSQVPSGYRLLPGHPVIRLSWPFSVVCGRDFSYNFAMSGNETRPERVRQW